VKRCPEGHGSSAGWRKRKKASVVAVEGEEKEDGWA
jgi:hypothetical protein